jgi:hypothetical protein
MNSLRTNDIVTLKGRAELWRVVARVNGTRADIQRISDPNPSIWTVPVRNLMIVSRSASTNSSF